MTLRLITAEERLAELESKDTLVIWGPSGIGKTSLSLIEVVGLSLGRDLLGNEKLRPHRCWYHNGEDTRDEINLRLGAICDFLQEMTALWVTVDSARSSSPEASHSPPTGLAGGRL